MKQELAALKKQLRQQVPVQKVRPVAVVRARGGGKRQLLFELRHDYRLNL